MRTLATVLIVLVFLGVCSAEERGLLASDHVEPCEVDVVISDGSSTRAPAVVLLDLLAIPVLEAPRLVWHCGTPDPPPPPLEALTTVDLTAVALRAPPAD
jgi:hypothetical protein